MELTQGTREYPESMASAYKEQILNLLDEINNDDLIFLRQIFTMMKTPHCEKVRKEGYTS